MNRGHQLRDQLEVEPNERFYEHAKKQRSIATHVIHGIVGQCVGVNFSVQRFVDATQPTHQPSRRRK